MEISKCFCKILVYKNGIKISICVFVKLGILKFLLVFLQELVYKNIYLCLCKIGYFKISISIFTRVGI